MLLDVTQAVMGQFIKHGEFAQKVVGDFWIRTEAPKLPELVDAGDLDLTAPTQYRVVHVADPDGYLSVGDVVVGAVGSKKRSLRRESDGQLFPLKDPSHYQYPILTKVS